MMNKTQDTYIAYGILKSWKEKNMFVVYGMNHLICQKKVFKE